MFGVDAATILLARYVLEIWLAFALVFAAVMLADWRARRQLSPAQVRRREREARRKRTLRRLRGY